MSFTTSPSPSTVTVTGISMHTQYTHIHRKILKVIYGLNFCSSCILLNCNCYTALLLLLLVFFLYYINRRKAINVSIAAAAAATAILVYSEKDSAYVYALLIFTSNGTIDRYTKYAYQWLCQIFDTFNKLIMMLY